MTIRMGENHTMTGNGVTLTVDQMVVCTKATIVHLMQEWPDGQVPLFDLMGVCAAEMSKVLLLSEDVYEMYVLRNADFNYLVCTLAISLIARLAPGQAPPTELLLMKEMYRLGIVPPVNYHKESPE